MKYLGTYTIKPFDKDIEVDCYGFIQPAERQTLEHSGCGKHVELEKVTHGEINITDYLHSDIWDELESKINGL